MIKRLWRFISSHTLALWLLGFLVLTSIAAGSLPQSARLSPEQQQGWQTDWEATASWFDTLGLSHIVGSWWFQALCILMVVNMLAGILVAIGRKWAFCKGELRPSHELEGMGAFSGELPPGLKVTPANGATSSRVRGVLGLLGLPLFHVGIAIIVAGGFWSAQTDYSDFMELSVGEVFDGNPAKTQRKRPLPLPFDAKVRLDQLNIKVREGKYMELAQAQFSYQEGDGPIEQVVVESNHPLQVAGYELHVKNSFGYSAMFDRILADGTKRLLYVAFPVERVDWDDPSWSGEKKKPIRFDGVPLYYNMVLSAGTPPKFALKVNKGREVVFDGELYPGMSADLGPYKLVFKGVVPWMTFSLVYNWAPILIFAGFIVTLAGYLLHLVVYSRRVELSVNEDGWRARAWVNACDTRFERQWQAWCKQQGEVQS